MTTEHDAATATSKPPGPATSKPSEPANRTHEELLEAHRAARARRAAAPLGSEAYLEAAEEIGQIEVEIARIGHEASPPTV
jgi:hypothetical protein